MPSGFATVPGSGKLGFLKSPTATPASWQSPLAVSSEFEDVLLPILEGKPIAEGNGALACSVELLHE